MGTWHFCGTVGLVPWVGKAVLREVVLCRYREGGTLGTALWRCRGNGNSKVLWGWCRGRGRRCRGVGAVGRKGGTVGGDVVQIVVVPWGWYFRGTVEMVPWEVVLCRYREGGTLVTALWWYREGATLAAPWERYRGGTMEVLWTHDRGSIVGAAPWQYRKGGTVAVPWEWYRGGRLR